MKKLEYCWAKDPKGQFVDGHERDDVVAYQQEIFLPAWAAIKEKTRDWSCHDRDGDYPHLASPQEQRTVVWWHDESTFYANERCKTQWVHKSETAVPYAKGEGPSQMVADLISADYRWLRSPDGKEEACVFFKAGKNREGYFTNQDILKQAGRSMDILEKHYANENHVLVFDNATTHSKCADGALSARNMPKGTSKADTNWGVEVNVRDVAGKQVYSADGKLLKEKIQMIHATFADRSKQSLYFGEDAGLKAGLFKGMAVILHERGLIQESNLQAQCKDFKCAKGAPNCCCRRVLYNQPDFVAVESNLEKICKARGFSVLFLPKFHCELNFIEQCWGYAKHVYHQYPASSKEADLEWNVLSVLKSVPLNCMRRCVNC
jgi:hypothetical protein